MSQLRFVPASLLALAFLGLSATASAVAAPGALPAGCGDGPACAYGYECTAVGGSGCAEPACAPGMTCPPVDCQPTTIYGCTPAHCSSDSQCSPGMVCHQWEEPCAVSDCACPPNTPSCNCGGPTSCTPTVVSMCTPKYVLPCTANADCGAGFTCEMQPSCACGGTATGTAGTAGAPIPLPAGGASAGGAPAAGAPSEPIDPTCDCTTQTACVATPVECKTSADCQAGWSCVMDPAVDIARPACPPDMPCDPLPAPAPTTSHCLPPYYGANSSGGLQVPGAPGSTTTIGTIGPTNPGTGGSGNTGTGGKTSNNGTAGSGSSDSHEVAACSIGHAPASASALSLFAMLGALLGLSRRRARR